MRKSLPTLILPIVFVALTATASLFGQQPDTLGISEVRANPAVRESVRGTGKLNEMNRVLEALDGQLIDRMNNTRKFQIVSRSDLPAVLREQDLAESGLLAERDEVAPELRISGVKYLLVPVVDDFQDLVETAEFEAMGQRARRRTVRLSAVARIYDAADGRLLESANFQIDSRDVTERADYVKGGDDASGRLLVAIARQMAENIALRVIDVTHPATIVAKTGDQVTVNRGDGAGMVAGEKWEVFAVGEEMIDPGTGVSLGREEVSVGEVVIDRVTPRVAIAKIREDRGIERLHILRRKEP